MPRQLRLLQLLARRHLRLVMLLVPARCRCKELVLPPQGRLLLADHLSAQRPSSPLPRYLLQYSD